MLKGVEDVCFIDSFVVRQKEKFLDAYKSAPNRANCSYDTSLQRFRRKAERYTKRKWAIKYIIAKCNRQHPQYPFAQQVVGQMEDGTSVAR